MTKSLSVRLSGIPLGILEQTDEGKLRFEYLDDAKVPISQGLPLTQKRYGNINCEAYFAGLLPESIEARMAIATKYSVSPNNTFGFLACIGHDCAGAISLLPLDTPVVPDEIHSLQTMALLDTELEKHIIDLPHKPLFMGVEGLRLCLAGVQEKAAVCFLDNKVSLPLEDTPTTHILKPPIKRFHSTVQNEYLCIKAASALGITVPNVEMRKAGIHEYLLVERFDRQFPNANNIVRIHQEDFCQALGARQKYERFQGPGLKHCFDLLLKSAIPAIDRNKLLEIVVFNFLIGNADAHAKNFGLLYNESGNFRVAPFYDLLCTQIYEGLTRDMSMKIGKEYDPDNLTVEDWQLFCKKNEMSFPVLRKVIDNQSKNLPIRVRQLDQEISKGQFSTIITSQIYEQVEKNCQLVRRKFNFQ
jgi:serine/threonine-protein kinase HipA